jgi:hypothetical protein
VARAIAAGKTTGGATDEAADILVGILEPLKEYRYHQTPGSSKHPQAEQGSARGEQQSSTAMLFTRLRGSEGARALRVLLGDAVSVRALGLAWRRLALGERPRQEPRFWHDDPVGEVHRLVPLVVEAEETDAAVRDLRRAGVSEKKVPRIMHQGIVASGQRFDLVVAVEVALRYELDLCTCFGHHRYARPLLAAACAISALTKRGVEPEDPLALWGLRAYRLYGDDWGGQAMLAACKRAFDEALAAVPDRNFADPPRLRSDLDVLEGADGRPLPL